VLIVLGLLPVWTIPVFHIWLLIIGFPPVWVLCVVCLFVGIWLLRAQKTAAVPARYLLLVPSAEKNEHLCFCGEGIELCGEGAETVRWRDYGDFTALYATQDSFYLLSADQRVLVLPKKDFRKGTPSDFSAFISEKCGKEIKYIN